MVDLTASQPADIDAVDTWQKVLTDGHASLVRARRLFRYLRETLAPNA